MKTAVTLLLVFLTSISFSQTQEEKIRQAELDAAQIKKVAIDNLLELAIDLMDQGEYVTANEKFKEVLTKAPVVPTDLTFYFGKNSFYMEKYQQSIDWLNKYLELKGTAGRYYDECVLLLEDANRAFLNIKKEEREEVKDILASNYQIDCGPSGKVVCPVCSGAGVIIERGAFDRIYKTCPYSDNHGYLTCDEYNQLLKGTLKPKF